MGTLVILLISVCVLEIHLIAGMGYGMEPMVGKGIWTVHDIHSCEDADQYPCQMIVKRERINRTHEGFSGSMNVSAAIDLSYAIRLESCKWVDGGCKPFQKINDDCFCCFAKKHAGSNFKRILEGFGIDPSDCPISQGYYEIENFIFNYDELPEDGLFGKFDAKIFLIKDHVDVACMMMVVDFTTTED